MSYELIFWRYEDEDVSRAPEDHQDVYLSLCKDEEPSGLKPLPWPGVRTRMKAHFGRWKDEGDVWSHKGVTVEMSGTDGSVRFDLRGHWTGEHANPLIDIMKTYRCPLFDPQAGPLGVRFELSA